MRAGFAKEALQAAKARGTKLGSNRPGHWAGREYLRQAGQRNQSSSYCKPPAQGRSLCRPSATKQRLEK